MIKFCSEVESARILLVEDQEDSKELVTVSLNEYTVIWAMNFDEGLRFAQNQDFDLYILDNWLPDRSGVELCGAIREFDPDTPILFHSSATYARDRREAIRAGAQEYLTKPTAPEELQEIVAQLLSTNIFN
jgi:DNA-binding response OmpR family regulator